MSKVNGNYFFLALLNRTYFVVILISTLLFYFLLISSQEKYEETADKSSKTCVQTVPPPADTPMPETASTDSNVSSVSVISDMPATNISPSLQFLRTAHEHLGR